MQEIAGHARMATTLEIYTHVNMDAKRGVDEGGIRRVLMWERSAETICPNLKVSLDSFQKVPYPTCSNVRHSLSVIEPDAIENR